MGGFLAPRSGGLHEDHVSLSPSRDDLFFQKHLQVVRLGADHEAATLRTQQGDVEMRGAPGSLAAALFPGDDGAVESVLEANGIVSTVEVKQRQIVWPDAHICSL